MMPEYDNEDFEALLMEYADLRILAPVWVPSRKARWRAKSCSTKPAR